MRAAELVRYARRVLRVPAGSRIPVLISVLIVHHLLMRYGKGLPEDDRPLPLRPWQPGMIKAALGSGFQYVVLELCRQAGGKTFVAALIITTFLLCGLRVFIALPTLRQGSRILMRRVDAFMSVLERPFKLRRAVKNELEKTWSNGAMLSVLSSNDAGVKSTQGYTYHLGVLDEAHEIAFKDLGYYTPLLLLAMKKGIGLMLGLGPAGMKGVSMVEVAKDKPAWKVLQANDEEIIRQDDEHRAKLARLDPDHPELRERSWREQLAEEEANTDQATYDQFFRLIPVTAGSRYMFHEIPAELPWEEGAPLHKIITIDVGKTRDATVVTLYHLQGRNLTLWERELWHGDKYNQQVRAVARWVLARVTPRVDWMPEDTIVECNGPGAVFADFLAEIDPFYPLTRQWTTDTPGGRRKTRALLRVMGITCDRNRQPLIRFACRPRHVREKLESLQYELEPDGSYIWPHDDDLTGVWLTQFRGTNVAAA